MSNLELQTSALELAARGYPVLPVFEPTAAGSCTCASGDACKRAGKHPRTEHGLLDATCDEAQICEWWLRWPEANVAVAVPAGHLIVDIDSQTALGDMEASGYTLPTTTTVGTARGLHLWFLTPNADQRSTVGVLPSIDFRGPGSFVLVPSSRHASGAQYEWVVGLDHIADAPDWVYSIGRAPATGIGCWRDRLGHPIAEGEGRNSTLASYAGYVFRHFPATLALEACHFMNSSRFEPPLDPGEFQPVVNSIAGRELRRRKGGDR